MQKSFVDLYNDAVAMPTPRQEFIAEIVALTRKTESSVRRWAVGAVYPSPLEQETIAEHFGIPVIDMPWWDENIKSYFDNGTVYDHPHRALLCPVGQTGILGLGCDSISNFSKLDIWYDKNSRNTRFLAMGSSDAKLLDPTLFMAAY